jgi:hypothetical protein
MAKPEPDLPWPPEGLKLLPALKRIVASTEQGDAWMFAVAELARLKSRPITYSIDEALRGYANAIAYANSLERAKERERQTFDACRAELVKRLLSNEYVQAGRKGSPSAPLEPIPLSVLRSSLAIKRWEHSTAYDWRAKEIYFDIRVWPGAQSPFDVISGTVEAPAKILPKRGQRRRRRPQRDLLRLVLVEKYPPDGTVPDGEPTQEVLRKVNQGRGASKNLPLFSKDTVLRELGRKSSGSRKSRKPNKSDNDAAPK